MDRRCGRVLASLLVAGVLSCGGGDDGLPADPTVPEAIGDQEGAVCGMMVRDQSAPRGQVVHRDGTRLFLCSLGDLLVQLSAPSPHGQVEEIFVEVLDPAESPGEVHRGPHPWIPARDAIYVVGVARPAIMGDPVLAYASESDAAQVAARHPGADRLDFEGLQRWWRASMAAP